eukprot:4646950-Prymnesium_polylepis.1
METGDSSGRLVVEAERFIATCSSRAVQKRFCSAIVDISLRGFDWVKVSSVTAGGRVSPPASERRV